jgi:hypothetical protein
MIRLFGALLAVVGRLFGSRLDVLLEIWLCGNNLSY